MRDRHFMEDENELPFLVSSKRDDYNDRRKFSGENSSNLYDSAVELKNENKLEEALELINILIDRNSDDDQYWNLKGIIYADFAVKNGIFGDRQYEESIKCFNIAIKLDPNDYVIKENKALTLIDYANILHSSNQYSSAVSKIDDALSLLDENKTDKHTFAKAWNLKALCYHACGDSYAFKCYDKALDYEPHNETIKKNKNDLRHYHGIDNEYFYG